jgi:hypothetical protein
MSGESHRAEIHTRTTETGVSRMVIELFSLLHAKRLHCHSIKKGILLPLEFLYQQINFKKGLRRRAYLLIGKRKYYFLFSFLYIYKLPVPLLKKSPHNANPHISFLILYCQHLF